MKIATIIVKCDALDGECGTEIPEEVESQVIVWNGEEYTFDICDKHDVVLADALRHLLNDSTMTKGKPKARTRKSPMQPAARPCPHCPDHRMYVKLGQHITKIHPDKRTVA